MTTEPRSAEDATGQYVISVESVVKALRKRFYLVVLAAVWATVVAATLTLMQEPVYEASIKILVKQEADSSSTPNDVSNLQLLTQTMTTAVETGPVAETVIQRLRLQTTPQNFLEQGLSAEQIGTSQFIQVGYKDPDPQMAKKVVSTVGEVFADQMSQVNPSGDNITATVWEEAAVPEDSVSPNTVLNLSLGALLGLMLGAGLAIFLGYLDDSWASPQEPEQVLGVPTLCVVPEIRNRRGAVPKGKRGVALNRLRQRDGATSEQPITLFDPESCVSDAYRALYVNLFRVPVHNRRPKVVLLTSPNPEEGRSTTCANLGVTLAQAGNSVLLLDGDLRRPSLHKRFGLRNTHGLVQVLTGERSARDMGLELPLGMKLIPTGGVALSDSTHLLASTSLLQFLNQARKDFDYVLISGPAAMAVADTTVLATQVDGVLLVVDYRTTSRKSAWRTVQSLKDVGARVAGVAMNNVRT